MSDDRWIERYPILTGRVWGFGLEVPADCIVPPGASGAGRPGALLMTPVDPDFPDRIEPGDLLVGGSFGAGTIDDGPVDAIRDAGIAAVVASTLDRAFAERAVRAGLPVVEVHEALGIHTGEILRVDLEGARVVNMSSGDRYPIRNLDDAMLEIYRRSLEDGDGSN